MGKKIRAGYKINKKIATLLTKKGLRNIIKESPIIGGTTATEKKIARAELRRRR